MIIIAQPTPMWAVLAFNRGDGKIGYTVDRVIAWAVDPAAGIETGPRPITFDLGSCGSWTGPGTLDAPVCVGVHDTEAAADEAADVAHGRLPATPQVGAHF